MTFQEKMLALLQEHGLFDTQAQEILQIAMQEKCNEAMQGRWDDVIEGYPAQIVNVLWLSVKQTALEWIDAHVPQAWFRPLFSGENV